MRNLIGFFWKYHFTLLFVVLELVAWALLVSYNDYHRAQAFNQLLNVSGSVSTSVHNLTEYVDLKEVNEQLATENAWLRSRSSDSFTANVAAAMERYDSLAGQRYTYVPAQVVNSTTHKMNNQLTLNVGSRDGIAENMGVVGPNGVVGQVKHVSEHFASVLPLIHKDSRVGARFQNNNYFGLVSWRGLDPTTAAFSDISSHVAVQLGDTVVTRGSNTLFPAGIPVGTVTSFEAIPGEGEYEIELQLTTDFRSLSHVYVVTNLLQGEQLELEAQFNEEENE